MCVCVPLNYLTCEKNDAIEMQHNNNNNKYTLLFVFTFIELFCAICYLLEFI